MEQEAIRMTAEEKTRLKDQLLTFVERVSATHYDQHGNQRMPEEVNALPAIIRILLDWC